MNEQHSLLAESATRLFGDLVASRPDVLDNRQEFELRWRPFAEMGLQSLLVPEDRGGFGGGVVDAWLVFHLAGLHAVDLPVVEAILAADILGAARLDIPTGILSVASRTDGRLELSGNGGRFTGYLRDIPWGRFCAHIVAMVDTDGQRFVICLDAAQAADRIERSNGVDEPRDDWRVEAQEVTVAPCGPRTPQMLSIGALARSAQIAGACRSALNMSLAHAVDRKQFGKSIGKFQSIQHSLATLAEQVQLAESSSRAAFESLPRGGGEFEIGAAKIIANMAAEQAVAIAHQVHGAIGFTWEYDLHHATRRLLTWAREFGNLQYWNGVVGSIAASRGPRGLWPMVVNG